MFLISLLFKAGCSALRSTIILRIARGSSCRLAPSAEKSPWGGLILEAFDLAIHRGLRGPGHPRPLSHRTAEQHQRADLFILFLLGPLEKRDQLIPVAGGFDSFSAPHKARPPHSTGDVSFSPPPAQRAALPTSDRRNHTFSEVEKHATSQPTGELLWHLKRTADLSARLVAPMRDRVCVLETV